MLPAHRNHEDIWTIQRARKSGAVHDNYKKTFTRAGAARANGAYMLSDWQFRRRMRFEATLLLGSRHVKSKVIDKIIPTISPGATRCFASGGVDWITDLTGDTASDFRPPRSGLHVFPPSALILFLQLQREAQ